MKTYSRILTLLVLFVFCGTLNVFGSPDVALYDFNQDCWNPSAGNDDEQYRVMSLDQSSKKTQRAYQSFSDVYEFYESEFGWASTDGHGKPIILVTNLSFDEGDGCNSLNAFMYGDELMAILFGLENHPLDLASDIDILGHEFTHGVFSAVGARSTHPENQALNESIADMMGVTIHAWAKSGKDFDHLRITASTYKVGKTFAEILALIGHPYPDKGIRVLKDPSINNELSHYDDRFTVDNKYSLAAVSSLAYYLLAEGGGSPDGRTGIRVNGIGLQKASKLVFYTLEHRLPFIDMPDFANALKKAARKMYGKNSSEEESVHNAFAAVGILGGVFVAEVVPPTTPVEPPPTTTEEPATTTQTEPETRPTSEPQPNQPQEEQIPSTNDTDSGSTDTGNQSSPEPAENNNSTLSGPFFIIVFCGVIGLLLIVVLIPRKKKKVTSQGKQSVQVIEINASGQSSNSNVVELKLPAHENLTIKVNNGQKTGIAILIDISGSSFKLKLDEEPVTIGRDVRDLPTKLLEILAQDEMISRIHCQVFYKQQTDELYVLNLSSNGTKVCGDMLSDKDEKGKLPFNKSVDLQIGRTILSIRKI